MVRGGSDILFQVLNAGRAVRKKLGGWIWGGGGRGGDALFPDTKWGQKFVHTSLTHVCVFLDTTFFSCLRVRHF